MHKIFILGKPQLSGKTQPNEISLTLAKTLARLAKWAFNAQLPNHITMKYS